MNLKKDSQFVVMPKPLTRKDIYLLNLISAIPIYSSLADATIRATYISALEENKGKTYYIKGMGNRYEVSVTKPSITSSLRDTYFINGKRYEIGHKRKVSLLWELDLRITAEGFQAVIS